MTKAMTPDDARAAILAGTAPEGLTVGEWLDLRGCTEALITAARDRGFRVIA